MTTWREELAWAAGFYDGEGCTYLGNSHGKLKIRMTVVQNSTVALERFKKALLGLGYINGPYGDHNMYSWSVSSYHDCQATIGMLGTFLGLVKREQIQDKLSQAVFNAPRDLEKCSKGHTYSETGRRTDGKCAECAREYDRKRYEKGRIINGTLKKKKAAD